jgi:uncharacterized protein (DUF488 family)
VRIYSVGHSNLRANDFVSLLRDAGIAALADVRRQPGSRRFPWFSRGPLAASLEETGVTYLWVGEGLGGRLEPKQPEAQSPNRALRDPALRAYADSQGSPAFERELALLIEQAVRAPTAVMCAERDWRACHRRILADVLVARGWQVLHLRPAADPEPHVLSASARVEAGRVTYPTLV